jgi:glucose-6-phosphate 1-epimerase
MVDEDVARLEERHGQPGSIGFEVSPRGGAVARLRSAHGEATVAIKGGQVLSWMHAGVERLWLSPVSRLDTTRAVRGGVPVCWPWFGAHASDPTKPAHGFARIRPWEVVSSEATPGCACLVLAYQTDQHDAVLWPGRAGVQLKVMIAETLRLELETRNTGSEPFLLTQALHTYFWISDVAFVRVEGLRGCAYLDNLDGLKRKVEQSERIRIDREVDRIYLGDTRRIVLADEGFPTRRRVVIDSEGSASAVVWNPWADKTIRLGDMGAPDAFRTMLCVETANAGDDAITLAPGASHRVSVGYTAD